MGIQEALLLVANFGEDAFACAQVCCRLTMIILLAVFLNTHTKILSHTMNDNNNFQ